MKPLKIPRLRRICIAALLPMIPAAVTALLTACSPISLGDVPPSVTSAPADTQAEALRTYYESLIADLAEPAESKEFRMDIAVEDFKTYGQSVLDQLQAYAAARPGWTIAPNNFEGVRVNLDADHGNGWFLLRLSLHDPLMPLNIESDSVGGVKVIAAELAPFLTACDQLNTEKLAAFVQ